MLQLPAPASIFGHTHKSSGTGRTANWCKQHRPWRTCAWSASAEGVSNAPDLAGLEATGITHLHLQSRAHRDAWQQVDNVFKPPSPKLVAADHLVILHHRGQPLLERVCIFALSKHAVNDSGCIAGKAITRQCSTTGLSQPTG